MQPPSALASTYQQYKLDTNAVAGWLASTARSLGYPAHLLLSPTDNKSASSSDPFSAAAPHDLSSDNKRLKGKDRVKAKKAAAAAAAAAKASSSGAAKGPKYIISISSFVTLAEFIAGKSAPVPASFGAVLDRAISTRSEYGSKLSRQGFETDQQTESTHQHFVRVLEKVRDVLRPFTLAPGTDDGNGRDAGDDGDLPNRFDGLHVDEPSQAFLDLPDVERPAPVAVGNETYEAQVESTMHHAMFVFEAMLADMMRIRARVWSIWSPVKEALDSQDSRVDLAAAAIATDTAISLAKGIVEEATSDVEAFGGVEGILGGVFGHAQAQGPDNMEEYLARVGRKAELIRQIPYDAVVDTYLWPYITLDMHLQHLASGNKRKIPSEPLPKEIWDPSRERSLLSDAEKHDADFCLLTFHIGEVFRTSYFVKSWPVLDELFLGIKEMEETNMVPFYAAFACQVFLDLVHMLGENLDKCHDRFNSSMAAMRLEADAHLALAKQYGSAGVGQDRVGAVLRSLQKDIDFIVQDPLYKLELASMRGGETEASAARRRTSKLVRMSPVMSGLLTHHFRVRLRDASLMAAYESGSIQCGAHLYNVLLQQGLLGPTLRWPDMEQAMCVLGEGAFFVGKRPTGDRLENYISNFAMYAGTPVSAFKKMKRLSANSRSRYDGLRPMRLLKAQPHVLSAFDDRYVYGDSGLGHFTAEHIENVIETSRLGYADGSPLLHPAGLTESSSSSSSNNNNNNNNNKKKKKKKEGAAAAARNRRRLMPDQLIVPLWLALQMETQRDMFSHMTLHCAVTSVLLDVTEACEARLTALGKNSGGWVTRPGGSVFRLTVVCLLAFLDRPALEIAAGVLNDTLDRGCGILAIKKAQETAIKTGLMPARVLEAAGS
ncbi:hypothetical protein MAPG_09098 [Magnaporthiopsis poae ATCC 64411]|uniref:DUF6604 domain-containing protein n=1 Tax=Magnaporthiopsis poae (strain ATCC 64411 / 73-15) TaxID=644358 RepID=A0A0C4E922_MAGP6|nr:hypothetical protein MAPG_09098 [Magnaporthiopsis poae ATCC 64411]